MDKIHKFEPNEEFPLNDLVLTTPIVISSDNFFIKYLLNNGPVYIQAPKCTTKQGIIKGGKKMYCDLLFTNENGDFIKWIEDLEVYSQKYIFNNRDNWFESDLALDDIENSFTSSLKIYKSGKYYILRTIIPTRLGKCNIKLFDEDEKTVEIDKIIETTNVIPILEFQGIKCSKINFQIDVEIKQMMILKPTKLFETCKIHPNKIKEDDTDTLEPDNINIQKKIKRITLGDIHEFNKKESEDKEAENNKLESAKYLEETEETEEIENKENSKMKEEQLEKEVLEIEEPETEELEKEVLKTKELETETEVLETEELETEELETETEGLEKVSEDEDINDQNNLEKLEIDFNLENFKNDDTIKIKERNEVYYKIYQEAITRAKQARSLAISAFLEAKQIKNLYMLDDVDDNIDNSIEEQ